MNKISITVHFVPNIVPSKSKMSRARNWCWTINNPEVKPHALINASSYTIYQLEVGENGTEHYQGYSQFDSPMRLNALKKLAPTAHFEVAKGSADDNEKYCSKEDGRKEGPWRHGSIKRQGQRSDLELIADKVINLKSTVREIAADHPQQFIRYHKGIIALRTATTKPRDFVTSCHVIFGPTMVGKTHDTYATYPDAYWKPQGEWWDGYDGHSVVIIDEFDGWLPFTFMLRLLDKTPIQVPFKGGFHQFVAHTVVLLSNKPPEQWYDSSKYHMNALYRRFTTIKNKITRDIIHDVTDNYFRG